MRRNPPCEQQAVWGGPAGTSTQSICVLNGLSGPVMGAEGIGGLCQRLVGGVARETADSLEQEQHEAGGEDGGPRNCLGGQLLEHGGSKGSSWDWE